jgi:LPS sulfotransferase NodH
MLPQAVGFSGNLTTESYLICTTHRSGSNLLCQVLTDSKVTGKPGEFFSDKLRARLTGLLSLPENLTPIEFFRGAMHRTTGTNGLFGAKVMPRHLQHALQVIRPAFRVAAQATDLAVLSALLPKPRFVWLHREDVLRQAISLARAKQTKAWNARKAPAIPAVFDFAQIDQCVGQIERANAFWKQWFSAQGIQVHQITYEQMVADYQRTVRAVLAFVGQPLTTDIPLPTLPRQADSLTEDWANRYAQLKNDRKMSSPAAVGVKVRLGCDSKWDAPGYEVHASLPPQRGMARDSN